MTIYNPHLLERRELLDTFVAREPLLETLLDDLRRGGRQHHLLIGDRGSGKTTLLLRLAAAIEDDKQLAKNCIPLRFPEEQYNVFRPSDFWMNALDALADALTSERDAEMAAQLEDTVSKLALLPEEDRARESLTALESWAKQARRTIVLLVDNLDLVLQRLASSHWAFREALSNDNRLTVIGASSKFLEETIDYHSPFYDFFSVHDLGPVSEDEARQIVLALAHRANTPSVKDALERDPGRFRALYVLTGGMPRTLALLHTVLALDNSDRIERDLDGLLDQLTPYYKARFDDLPTQHQVVIDKIALHWHPMTAAECQAATQLEINLVSAQLNRLVKSGVLTKVAMPEGSKLGYQLSERFFNIWYLMRASRRLRRRLSWFVEFLRLFYGDDDLRRRAEALTQDAPPETTSSPARFLAFASAVPDFRLRQRLEFRAIRLLLSNEVALHRELLDIEGEDIHLAPVIDRVQALREIETIIARACVSWPDNATAGSTTQKLLRQPLLSLRLKKILASGLASGTLSADKLIEMLRVTSEGMEFHARLLNAIASGEAPSLDDVSTLAELQLVLELDSGFLVIVWLLGFGRETPLTDEMIAMTIGLAPDAKLTALVCAKQHIGEKQWGEGRRLFLHTIRDSHDLLPMEVFVSFFRACIEAGFAAHASELLVEADLHERWAPLYEAMLAVIEGRPRLDSLAPEVRAVASALCDQLQESEDSQPRAETTQRAARRAPRAAPVRPSRARGQAATERRTDARQARSKTSSGRPKA